MSRHSFLSCTKMPLSVERARSSSLTSFALFYTKQNVSVVATLNSVFSNFDFLIVCHLLFQIIPIKIVCSHVIFLFHYLNLTTVVCLLLMPIWYQSIWSLRWSEKSYYSTPYSERVFITNFTNCSSGCKHFLWIC